MADGSADGMDGAGLNPVERRMALLGQHWRAFTAQADKRLLLWQVPGNALRLTECFAEVQKLELPYATGDQFITVKLPYQHGLQFARGLKQSLHDQYQASRDDLRQQGLAADWAFDPAAVPDTPAGVLQALCSFGAHHQGVLRHLALVLMPTAVADATACTAWLRALLDAGLPERLRLLLIDPLESPRLPGLASLGAAPDPRVLVQHPAIDGLAAAQDTFAHEGGSGPAAVFRSLMMGTVALADQGTADQVMAKARDALAFARQQRWADQEVALRILVAGALLKEQRHAEALTVYQAARAAADETLRSAHPAGRKLVLQCWFGQAGVQLAAADWPAAAHSYDEAAVVAQQDGNAILAIEAFRMAGFCLARAGQPNPALQRLAAASEIGAGMQPDARGLTTLGVALADMLRILDPDRVATMQQAKRALQQALEAVRQRSEARGAALAAAHAPQALETVEAERQQQAAQAAEATRQRLQAAAAGAAPAFAKVLSRGAQLLGDDWLLDNDLALPPTPEKAPAP